MAKLGVNIDHVATLRQARGGKEPDPVAAAVIAEIAGADGITIHLREDRRHIQDRDLELLRRTVQTKLNLEMAATVEMVDIALGVHPDMCTLVPEKRRELTTEGGLDVRLNLEKITAAGQKLQKGGIRVSLFIDPDHEQIVAAKEAGADYIEIHTGSYAEAYCTNGGERELQEIGDAIELAASLGMRVNAGHGLNYNNIHNFSMMQGIEEFNIGHAIVSRAVFTGLDRAVREMVELVKKR